jgi:hypothetical protein
MIKRFFLIEAPQSLNINKVIDEIVTAIYQVGQNKTPTKEWIAGILNELRSGNMSDLRRLQSDNFDNEQARLQALSKKAMYDVLSKYDLIHKINEFNYKHPSANEKQRLFFLSKIREKSPQNKNTQLNDEDPTRLQKQMDREQDYNEASEIKQEMIELGYGHVVDVLQTMEPRHFSYLNNLIAEYEEAKKKKESYSKDIQLSLFNDKEKVTALANLGFIKYSSGKPLLNHKLINDTIEMLGEIDQEKILKLFKNFSKEIYHSIRRMSSDQTYKENAFIKRIYYRDQAVVKTADKIISDDLLTDEEKEELLNQQIQPLKNFIRLGIIKNGQLTDVGKAVRILVRWGETSVENALHRIQGATGRPDAAAYDPTTSTGFIASNEKPNRNMDDVERRKETAKDDFKRRLGNLASKGGFKEWVETRLDKTSRLI